MRPTQQGLEAFDRAHRELHKGLIEQVELLRLHRVAQVALQLDALRGRVPHRRVEHAHCIAACLLRPVHGGVRVADEILRVE